MKFVCPSCNKSFDIEAAPGVTIPCPACGSMLKPADEGGAQAEEKAADAGGGSLLDEILSGWGDEGGAKGAAETATEEPSLAEIEARAAAAEEPAPQPGEPAEIDATAPAMEGADLDWSGFAHLAQEVEQAAPQEAPAQQAPSGFADVAQAAGEAAGEEAGEAAAYEEAPAEPPRAGLETKPLMDVAKHVDTVDVLKPKGFPLAQASAPAKSGGVSWILFGVAAAGFVALAAVSVVFGLKASRAGAERAKLAKIAEEKTREAEKAVKELDEAEGDISDEKIKAAKKVDALRVRLAAQEEERKRHEEEARDKLDRAADIERKAREQQQKAQIKEKRAREAARRAEIALEGARKVGQARGLMGNPRTLGEAEKLLTKTIESGYAGPEARLWRGSVRAKLGRSAEAVGDFVRADELHPSGVMSRALLYAGDVSRTMRGDAQMATEFYRRAARGADDYARIASARYAEALGELDEALKLANDAVKKAPKLWETHLALAEIRAKKILAGSPSAYDEDSLEEVADEFREVTKLDPLHARAFASRADFLFDAYLATEDESLLREASKDAERAAEIDPRLCYARFIRARTLIALGRPRDALELLETVLDDEPWRSRAWVDKGKACLMIPDLDEAGVCFEEALKLDENSVVARLGLANVHLRLREYGMALRSLEKLAELREDWPEAHLLLGWYYLGAPGSIDPLKAKKEGELVDQWTGGGDVRALRLLAEATFDLKEYEEAKGYIRKGLKRAPGDEYLLNLLSRFKD